MSSNSGNIYSSARKAKGYTQEHSAELLGVSVESVRAYEGGQRLPPDDVVLGMVEIYNAPHLAHQHLQRTVLGKTVLPEVQKKDFAVTTLSLFKEESDVFALKRRLECIASDGIIDNNEKPEMDQIIKELDDLARAIAEFKCAVGGCIGQTK